MTSTTKTRATRFHIDATERLPSGALRVQGNFTKTGVFEYTAGDAVVRELRSDAEVFASDTLDSLLGAPVTVDHPASFVGLENWAHLSVGSVIKVEASPPYVQGTLLVHDERTISLIEAGKLAEVSLGYSTDIEEHTDSEDADFEQTNILYNHAALGPSGWGRLGRDVALRLDSASNQIMEDFTMTDLRTDAESTEEETPVVDAEETPETPVEETDAEETPEEETADAEEAPAAEEAPEETPADAEEAPEEAPEEEMAFDAAEANVALNTKLDAILEALAPKKEEDAEEVPAEEKTDARPESTELRARFLGTAPSTAKASFTDGLRAILDK